MLRNKLSTAIKVTSSLLALGLTSQANAFEVQAGDVAAEIYGFARMTASYDINEDISTTRGSRSGNFGMINTGSAEDNEVSGHFGADAFQSRLGVRTTSPHGVKVNVEGDFRSISGSPGNLRIRKAYAEYKNILIGRTFSNYTSFVGNTSILEFDGLAGAAGTQNRTSQVRYTSGPLSFSIEDSRSNILGTADKKNSFPSFTARYQNKLKLGTFSTAARVHEVAYDDGNLDDRAIGYAVFGAAKLPLTDTLTVQGAINYTNGANSFLWRSGSNYYGEDAYIKGNSIETIQGYGGTVGASIKVGQGSVNAGIGMTQLDWDDAVEDGIAGVESKHERNTNAMVNYQWSPVKAVNFGVQYSYFKVKKVSGDDGNASRLLFSSTYSF